MTIPATTSSGAPADPSAGADRPALVVVLHGTRSPAGSEDAELLRRRVCDRLPGTRVDVGWVDVHEETLERTLPAAGPAIVVPAFLSAGHHVTHDIPTAIERTHGRARTTSHVDPDLDPALRDRLTELGPLGDGVVLAPAGSNHERANRGTRATAERLSALLGRPVEVSFFHSAHPSPAEALARLRTAGAEDVSVATNVLLPGLSQKRIAALGLPTTRPIGVHEALIEAIVRRHLAALPHRPY